MVFRNEGVRAKNEKQTYKEQEVKCDNKCKYLGAVFNTYVEYGNSPNRTTKESLN